MPLLPRLCLLMLLQLCLLILILACSLYTTFNLAFHTSEFQARTVCSFLSWIQVRRAAFCPHRMIRDHLSRLFSGPAQIHRDGSRFSLDGPINKGFARMGWVEPVDKWGGLISREPHSYALPFVNMQEYSRSRPEWHLRWTSACPLMTWLLALEEHSFYLFRCEMLGHPLHKMSFEVLFKRS